MYILEFYFLSPVQVISELTCLHTSPGYRFFHSLGSRLGKRTYAHLDGLSIAILKGVQDSLSGHKTDWFFYPSMTSRRRESADFMVLNTRSPENGIMQAITR